MLSENLMLLREHRGLTKTAMANYLNLTLEGYSTYERGRNTPPAETLVKLADFFNVTVDFLLDRNLSAIKTDAEIDAYSDFAKSIVSDLNSLSLSQQKKVVDYVRLLKLDVSYQVQKNNKKKRVLPSGAAGSHQVGQAPRRIDAPPGVAAHGGGVLEIDAEIEEDLKNFGKNINNEE